MTYRSPAMLSEHSWNERKYTQLWQLYTLIAFTTATRGLKLKLFSIYSATEWHKYASETITQSLFEWNILLASLSFLCRVENFCIIFCYIVGRLTTKHQFNEYYCNKGIERLYSELSIFWVTRGKMLCFLVLKMNDTSPCLQSQRKKIVYYETRFCLSNLIKSSSEIRFFNMKFSPPQHCIVINHKAREKNMTPRRSHQNSHIIFVKIKKSSCVMFKVDDDLFCERAWISTIIPKFKWQKFWGGLILFVCINNTHKQHYLLVESAPRVWDIISALICFN